jgi:uncharacterized tellurite resistance protein B-like protein
LSQRIRQAILQRDYARLDEAGLDAEQLTRYLAVLARLAALDDVSVGEHLLVERIAEFLGVKEEGLARAFLVAEDRGVTTGSLLQGVTDRGLRVCLLRDAYRIATADREITPGELTELGVIASGLGIPAEVAAEIRTIALQEQMLQREFAALVRRSEKGELARR